MFAAIAEEFTAYATELGVPEITAIPISALAGDNVVDPSANMDWYGGPTVLEHLETRAGQPRPDAAATRALPGAVRDPSADRRAPRLPRLRGPDRRRHASASARA